MNEHWTTDPPEVGKRYWYTRMPDASHDFYAKPKERVMYKEDVQHWATWTNCGYIRSRSPIPDPQPPPLPSGDEKERQ